MTAPRVPAARAAALAPGTIHVFTDGACDGNPGPAACGVVLCFNGRIKELSHHLGRATNNIAELSAILHGLQMIKKRDLPVRVYADSAYAIGVLSNPAWKPRENVELIARIKELIGHFSDLRFIKVAGHRGVRYNERADRLARAALRQSLNRQL